MLTVGIFYEAHVPRGDKMKTGEHVVKGFTTKALE